jgi:hypothetical protein
MSAARLRYQRCSKERALAAARAEARQGILVKTVGWVWWPVSVLLITVMRIVTSAVIGTDTNKQIIPSTDKDDILVLSANLAKATDLVFAHAATLDPIDRLIALDHRRASGQSENEILSGVDSALSFREFCVAAQVGAAPQGCVQPMSTAELCILEDYIVSLGRGVVCENEPNDAVGDFVDRGGPVMRLLLNSEVVVGTSIPTVTGVERDVLALRRAVRSFRGSVMRSEQAFLGESGSDGEKSKLREAALAAKRKGDKKGALLLLHKVAPCLPF